MKSLAESRNQGKTRLGVLHKALMKRRTQLKHRQAADSPAFSDMALATINDSATYSCLTIRLTDTRTRPRSRTKVISAKARSRNALRF
jgi:hypothetical protein